MTAFTICFRVEILHPRPGLKYMQRNMLVCRCESLSVQILLIKYTYLAFRFHHALPVTSDMPSQTSNHNDPRAQPGQEAADMNDLVDALRTRGMLARKDDSLMPQSDDGSVGDFIPREFPGKSEFPGTSLFFNQPTCRLLTDAMRTARQAEA